MRRYQPRTPLQAIDPKAVFGLFSDVEEPENEERDDVTIVTIRGPLSQHDDWWTDSYEAIRQRVDEACQQAAPVVVLRIDSPGGDVDGLFDASRAIRAECQRTSKRLIVHVEGQCSSAAYALATAADRIVASRTASVGSIGVIAARLDETRAMESAGLKITLVSSGARKADGHTCRPMDADELATFQADIDSLAREFFEVVSLRRSISVEDVAAFEAASFRGSSAVKARLVDELGSFDHLLTSLGAANGEIMTKEEEARAALRSIAEDEEAEDEDREKARKALAALDGDEEEDDGDEEEDDSGGEEEAEDEEEEAEDDSDGEEEAEDEEDDKKTKKASGKSRTVSAATAGAIAARGSRLERRVAKLERREETSKRKSLIAAHGGVAKGMAKLLATKPLSEVRAVLNELPRPKKPRLGDAAATVTVAGTRGAGQEKASQLPPEEARSMRLAMGMDQEKFGVVDRGNALLLGAPESEGGE